MTDKTQRRRFGDPLGRQKRPKKKARMVAQPPSTPPDPVEAFVRKRIAELEDRFEQERRSIIMCLGTPETTDLGHVGPFRLFGVQTDSLDSITIQLGTLRQVLMVILENRKKTS